ncbi:MAG: sugar porter family MFS transporter [Planctomycetes bacterium]|nr:sugar porter family MFS transporter [Planctomycetota bacterium]
MKSTEGQGGSAVYLTGVCLVASLGGLLFGFDTAVISGTVERVTGQFSLDDLEQGWFTSAALVGCIFGAAVAGWLGDRSGRKPNLIVAAILFFVSALFSAIPPDFSVLIVARMVGGVGVGMASVLGPMYISELAPPKWRGRLVAFYQLSIVVGILLAYLSNWLIVQSAGDHPTAFGGQGLMHRMLIGEPWRAMFGAEMFPAGLFFLLLFLVPESPRWLIRAGRQDAGLRLLTRISGEGMARLELEDIRQTMSSRQGSIAELFRPGLRIALLVGVMLAVFGQLSGVNIVVYYGPKILAAAGFEEVATLMGQVGFGVINLIFTILALLLIDHLGRRPLLIGGMAVVTVALAAIGGLFLAAGAEAALAGDAGSSAISRITGIWIGVMICVYMAAISFSICAVIWVLTPEIFPNRVRGRAASICTFANWSTNALSAFAFPWFVATFGMHSGFFASSGICLLATLFFFRYVPETKGKSLEEIEQSWSR